MQARREDLTLDTRGNCDTIDVTEHAQKAIANAGLRDGLCTVFVAHSTCGVTTIEFEPGCNADLARVMEQVAPTDDGVGAQRAQRRHQRAQPRARRDDRPVGDGAVRRRRAAASACGRRSSASTSTTGPRQRRLVVQLLGA